MMETLYDVMFCGIQEGKNPEDVANAIAMRLMDRDKAAQLVQRGQTTLVKKRVALDVAERLTGMLIEAGANANFRPSPASGKTLELVAKTTKLLCPVCGYTDELHEGDTPAQICPQCGLVFGKYQAVQQRKLEVEAARARLLRSQEVRQEDQLRRQEQEDEERRRKELEDELRKKLGIPAAIKRRRTLWSSVAAILVLGTAAGAILVSMKPGRFDALVSMVGLKSSADSRGSASVAMGAGAAVGAKIPPEQLMALSQEMLDAASQPNPADSQDMLPAIEAMPAQAGLHDQVAQTAASLITSAGMTSDSARAALSRLIDADDDWNHFVLSQVRQRSAAKDYRSAQRLADQIADPLTRCEAQSGLAASLARAGQRSAADALLDQITERLAGTLPPERRVVLLTTSASALAEPKLSDGVQKMMDALWGWVSGIEPASARAEAWARLAIGQAQVGLAPDAYQSMHNASTILKESMPVIQRVRTSSALAVAFARLGSRDTATALLEQTGRMVDRIAQPLGRDDAIASLATAWAELGDLSRSVAFSAGMSSLEQRDHLLARLLAKEVFADRSSGLAGVAAAITTPAAKARAHAVLAAASGAQDQLQMALSLIAQVPGGLERSMLQGEIARILSHSALRSTMGSLFGQAEASLRDGVAGPDQEFGWASLAINRGRALEPAKAREYLGRIGNRDLADLTRQILADSEPFTGGSELASADR